MIPKHEHSYIFQNNYIFRPKIPIGAQPPGSQLADIDPVLLFQVEESDLYELLLFPIEESDLFELHLCYHGFLFGIFLDMK